MFVDVGLHVLVHGSVGRCARFLTMVVDRGACGNCNYERAVYDPIMLTGLGTFI